jgi:hypothetical protein
LAHDAAAFVQQAFHPQKRAAPREDFSQRAYDGGPRLTTVDGSKALEMLSAMLKEGGWIKAAIAAACGVFLLVAGWGWVPPLGNRSARRHDRSTARTS